MKPATRHTSRHHATKGMALIAALLLLLILSAVAIALMFTVNTEQQLQRTDLGNNLAYYGAEAGMEKMMADLGGLYSLNAAPTNAQITGLSAVPPTLPGVTYVDYTFTPTGVVNAAAGCPTPPAGAPVACNRQISSGPNAELFAQIVPLSLSVTADRPGGEEVRMIRRVEVALIPVFQFGVFSESDLSFFAGPLFDITGRVHTNSNLFIAAGSGTTFHGKIRAFKEVIRDQMANGNNATGAGRNGFANMPTANAGCDVPAPACRNLQVSPYEGSWSGGIPPAGAANPGWTSISTSTYNSFILNGRTGAKKLTLPFVKGTTLPFEIIRRPPPGELTSSLTGQSRLYNIAQVRVMLVDDPNDLNNPTAFTDGQTIRLANVNNNTLGIGPDYTNGVPVPGLGGNTYFAEGSDSGVDPGWVRPPNLPAAMPTPCPAASATRCWSLLASDQSNIYPGGPAGPGGYLRVEVRKADGTYLAVTREWLELGFARDVVPPNSELGGLPPAPPLTNTINPTAILLFQMPADRSSPFNTITTADFNPITYVGQASRNNWYPINMYETREGETRELSQTTTTYNCAIGGVMSIVDIDMKNLKRWLAGTIGVNGPQTEDSSQNGYILYFSDRRGMLPDPTTGLRRGEYGFEDIVNPNSTNGLPNGTLDAGEDANSDGTLEVYGATNLSGTVGWPTAVAQGGLPTGSNHTDRVDCMKYARSNWVSGARHGVRLVNGSEGNIPLRLSTGTGGFTLATENPAFILGDYNAVTEAPSVIPANFPGAHASTAVIADTVTLLSNAWRDLNSFANPAGLAPPTGAPVMVPPRVGRVATTTWYRVAIASGKNQSFPLPGYAAGGNPSASGPPADYGTDGGVHNFLRFLENWGAGQCHYRGSMVSFYYETYATGVFKCCGTVYSPPTRDYQFDLDFQDVNKMPPGTPRFQDVVNVGFQQVF